MKELASKVTEVIKGVHVVAMGMANAFLMEGDDGLTLIDGLPESAGGRVRGDPRREFGEGRLSWSKFGPRLSREKAKFRSSALK
jgi:hypothetical protein